MTRNPSYQADHLSTATTAPPAQLRHECVQEERADKLHLLAVYNARLSQREYRRAFILDRGLLNVKRFQVRGLQAHLQALLRFSSMHSAWWGLRPCKHWQCCPLSILGQRHPLLSSLPYNVHKWPAPMRVHRLQTWVRVLPVFHTQ